MRTALLIMAAGIGSRFGGGIKQLEPVGMHDEIIMDYSIHDAITAGFNKIIFVIRKDIENDFRERIGDRIEKLCKALSVEVAYAFQDMQDIPDGCSVPEGRSKPWGTGQAVLAARDMIREPFAVINADDYYGKQAFKAIHDYLITKPQAYCMAGFVLKNTLSENGGVTRGICKMQDGMLTDVVETHNIVKTPDGAQAEGKTVDVESLVSMNMWGFPGEEGEKPDYVEILQKDFKNFFETAVPANPMKAEYLLPIHIGGLLQENKVQVRVLETNDKWFGVTYKEDKPLVMDSFRKLIAEGIYGQELYSDLLK